MAIPILLAFPLLALQPSPAGVDADQFGRLVKAPLAVIHDVSFIYEGQMTLVGPRGVSPERQEKYRKKYQGTYTFRNDGSVLLDCYLRGTGRDALFLHKTIAVFGGKTEYSELEPDKRVPPGRLVRPIGSPGILVEEVHTPQMILFLWYFLELKNVKDHNYQDLGWEVIDGHKCLKVMFDFSPGPPSDKQSKYLMWIDLDRGAHPLRVDYLMDPPKVLYRTVVQLDRFRLPDGKQVWFPVSGTSDGFLYGKNYHDEPIVRETCAVVRSSIVFNQRLPDKAFSVNNKGRPEARELALKREFDETLAQSRPRPRTDHVGVEERLKDQLRQADRQAKLIEASSAAREPWSPTRWRQLGLAAASTVLVALAVILYRKL